MKRFPFDFMFQLTKIEFELIKFKIENKGNIILLNPKFLNLSELDILFEMNCHSSRSQFVALKNARGSNLKYLTNAFTKQGVAILRGVLRNYKTTNINMAIMRAFVDVRKTLLLQSNFNEQLRQIKGRINNHDTQPIPIVFNK